MRRYTTPSKSHPLSPLESADTKSPRICTFYSYLKSFVFNTDTSDFPQLLYDAQLQDGKGGACPFSFPALVIRSPAFRWEQGAAAHRRRYPQSRARMVRAHQSPVTIHQSPFTNRAPLFSYSYKLNLAQPLSFDTLTHSQGGGGPISISRHLNHFRTTPRTARRTTPLSRATLSRRLTPGRNDGKVTARNWLSRA